MDIALTPDEESKPSSFSYPPKVEKLGRANRIGQQVFYASLDAHTTLREIAKQIKLSSSTVYISKWEIRNLPESVWVKPIFMGIPDDENNPAAITQLAE